MPGYPWVMRATCRYQGYVSGPLGDNLSGKLVASHPEHDGFVDNIIMGIDQQDEDVNMSFRGNCAGAERMDEWLLSADYMEDDRADMGRFPVFGNGGPTVDIWESWGGGFQRLPLRQVPRKRAAVLSVRPVASA